MNKQGLIMLALFAFLFSIAYAHAASNSITATLKIIGLPAGAPIPIRFAPNYTTVDYTATNYTTLIPIYISASTNTTYHGRIPYQWQGAGTTVAYNGVTYTMVANTYTQILNTTKQNILGFYVYLNSSLWNSNETAELQASNSSLTKAQLMIAAIKNASVSVPYNGSSAAGSKIKAAAYDNGTITFTNTSIVQNPSYICLNITSQFYSGNLCKPGSYHLPIQEMNGHFGLQFSGGATSTQITVKLQSSLFGSQQMQYSGKIQVGSNTILLSSTGSSFSDTNTFTYYVGEPLNITLDGFGNSNYSAEDPSFLTPPGVDKVLNVSLDNQQSSAITAGTQVMLTFNALNYSSYFNGNTINFEVFNGITGNVLYSWLEGNVLNEQQSNTFNTVSNLILWVTIPSQIAASINAVNVITIGFNSLGTTFLNGNNMGIAPQLWCASAGNCPQTTYAQFDDGANVFNDYWNFAGSSGSGWTLGSGTTQNNGLSIPVPATGVFDYYPTPIILNAAQILDFYGSIGSGNSNSVQFWIGGAQPYGTFSSINSIGIGYYVPTYGLTSQVPGATSSIAGFVNWGTNSLYSIIIPSANPTSLSGQQNYIGTISISTDVSKFPQYPEIETQASASPMYIQYYRIRTYPPNGKMPIAFYGIVQTPSPPSPTTPTLTLSNTMIDQGQGILFTASTSGGTSPYTYNYLVWTYNAQTAANTIIGNMLTPANTYTSNSWFWQPAGNLYVGNSLFFANVIITDAHPTTVNSIPAYFGYNTMLGTPTISASNTPTIIAGQYEVFTAIASGGTEPYTYNYQVVNTIDGSLIANMLYKSVSSTSNTFAWQSPSYSAGNTIKAEVITTDGATTPTSAISAYTSTITILSPDPILTCTSVNGAAMPNGNSINTLLGNYIINCNGNPTGIITYTLERGATTIGTTTSNYLYSQNWDNSNDLWTFTTPGGSGYNSNSISFNINSIPYLLTGIGTNSIAYETFPENYTANLNITKAAANAVIQVTVNSIVYNSLKENINPTNQIFNTYYRIQLLGANDLAWTTNANLFINLTNGIQLNEGKIGTTTQTELWDYIPTPNSIIGNIIEGQNQTVGLTIADLFNLGLPTITTNVQIGNQISNFQTIGAFNYNAQLYSFINSQYNYAMPTNSNPVAITVNIPVLLSYMGNSTARNQQASFTTYLPYFESCNLANTANAIQYNWVVTPQLTPELDNVLMTGYYYIVKNTYVGNNILGIAAGFTATAASNTYTSCIYPSWSQFNAYGAFTYSANGFASSQFFLTGTPISNVLNKTTLYLLNTTNGTDYDIGVQNVTTSQLISSIVKVYQLVQNSGSYVLVNEFITPLGGTWQTILSFQQQYKFTAANATTGLPLATTPVVQAGSCGTSACTYIIPIGNTTLPYLQGVISNIKYTNPYGCIGTSTPSNVETVSCTALSLNGTSYQFQLRIDKANAFLNTTACITNQTGTSISLTCTVPNINKQAYRYYLLVKVNFQNTEEWYPLTTGQFGTQAPLYGALGFFIAFMIVAALALIFITKSPSLTLMAVGLGVVGSYFLKLFNATALGIGAFILIVAVILFIINRRD